MVLSLCGPQSLDDLQTLGTRFGLLLASGDPTAQALPPRLLQRAEPAAVRVDDRLDLLFAHEHLPEGTEAALELLLACLGDNRPGGWLAYLRQRGWLRSFKAEPLYVHAGQLLWSAQLQVSEDASQDEILASLQGWLGFLRQTDHNALNRTHAQLQQRRAYTASALELARRDSTGLPFRHLDEQGLAALRTLLDSLPHRDHGHWQLAPAAPLLATLPRHARVACPRASRSAMPCPLHAALPRSTCTGTSALPWASASNPCSSIRYSRWSNAPSGRHCSWISRRAAMPGNCTAQVHHKR